MLHSALLGKEIIIDQPTNRPTNQPIDQPAEGHEGS